MRRRIVARDDLAVGTVLSKDHVAFRRNEGGGAFVAYWELFEGQKLKRPMYKNEGIEFGDIDFSDS